MDPEAEAVIEVLTGEKRCTKCNNWFPFWAVTPETRLCYWCYLAAIDKFIAEEKKAEKNGRHPGTKRR